METAKYLCEFFFENFWHFVMLCCVGWSFAPKINNSSNSPTNVNWKGDNYTTEE